ncbi:unnamed protein product [Protopolystoma xenopodis]|uniref:Uncharacterized protein n=1 Tax=Protopolystoma xenopodis TaxID=117903 RepID=A0A448XCE0_9PLAT|nr:unnamed protein product [Protopolystoma xenopodis]
MLASSIGELPHRGAVEINRHSSQSQPGAVPVTGLHDQESKTFLDAACTSVFLPHINISCRANSVGTPRMDSDDAASVSKAKYIKEHFVEPAST